MKYLMSLLSVLVISSPALAAPEQSYDPEGSLAMSAVVYDGSSASAGSDSASAPTIEPAAGEVSANTSADPEGTAIPSGTVYAK